MLIYRCAHSAPLSTDSACERPMSALMPLADVILACNGWYCCAMVPIMAGLQARQKQVRSLENASHVSANWRDCRLTLMRTLQEKSEGGSGKSSLTNSNICIPVFSGPQQPAMPSTTVTSGESHNGTVFRKQSIKLQYGCAALQCSGRHD